MELGPELCPGSTQARWGILGREHPPPPRLAFVDPGLGCELPASRRVCVRVSVSLGRVCAAYRVVWCRVAPSLGASVRPSHNRVRFTTRGASP